MKKYEKNQGVWRKLQKYQGVWRSWNCGGERLCVRGRVGGRALPVQDQVQDQRRLQRRQGDQVNVTVEKSRQT